MISLYGIKQWLLFLKNDTSKTIDSLRTKIEHFGSEFFLLCKTFQKKLVICPKIIKIAPSNHKAHNDEKNSDIYHNDYRRRMSYVLRRGRHNKL